MSEEAVYYFTRRGSSVYNQPDVTVLRVGGVVVDVDDRWFRGECVEIRGNAVEHNVARIKNNDHVERRSMVRYERFCLHCHRRARKELQGAWEWVNATHGVVLFDLSQIVRQCEARSSSITIWPTVHAQQNTLRLVDGSVDAVENGGELVGHKERGILPLLYARVKSIKKHLTPAFRVRWW